MSMSSPPEEVVAGRYEVESELARGGMGVVYRARDRSTGQILALKRSLNENKALADLNQSMLKREYQTLVSLRHPYIIQVYDFGNDGRGPYYTMELLDGTDLRAVCPLPWRSVCAYLRDVASSLALLHSRRLIHCDVSVANIRLTSEGRAKLLDFGGLTSFGKSNVMAGSPPIMAPENLKGEDLDGRIDLYALGATAYYALCGRHAYPAAAVGLLPATWALGRPPPPSSLAPDTPRELDELVLALLELERMSRPPSAAEVIDRLNAIAGLPPDQDPRVRQSYLHSSEVVARGGERALLLKRLQQLLSGRGGSVLIEGPSGLGKSHLLGDFAQRARVAGARVLTVEARTHPGELGMWSALVRDAVSGAAVEVPAAEDTGSSEALMKLAGSGPLVLALENLHEADGGSLAACLALAKRVRTAPILIVATLDPAQPQAERPVVQALRKRSIAIELSPFDEAATHAFVTGLFGDVAAAPRLSMFLYHHAAGNPGTYTQIVQHLLDQGFIRYADGTWLLPDELPSVGPNGLDLSKLVDEALEARIRRWSPSLLTLALCLSPHRRVFDVALCGAIASAEPELEGQSLPALLGELVREGVLLEDGGSYVFSGSRIRDLLYQRLSDGERKRYHARLGRALAKLSGDDPKRGFEIGFHFLLADQEKKARKHINRTVAASLMDADLIVEAVPDLRAILERQRAAFATDEEVQFIEGVLIVSGYYLDPSVHERAEHVLTVLHRTLGFALGARLAPWLGRHLGLTIGLLVAWARGLFRKPYLVSGGTFAVPLLIFIGAAAAWSAGSCFRLDRKAHPRLLELFDVARGLGKHNAFSLLHDLFVVAKDVVWARFAQVEAGFADQLARLPRIPLMIEQSRHQYEAGLQFFVGRNQLLRLDSKTLACAERMDELGGRHDRLMAVFLRRTFHLYRGDLAAAKREEDRFDQMAAMFGSRWVADVMSVLELLPYHLAGDVLGLKRTLHRIESLLTTMPGLSTHREVVCAMYEGHRGRPDLALKIYASLEAELAPFGSVVWSVARAHKAECLNALGRSTEALQLCEEARPHLTEADRAYVFAYQQLEREAALALAALGETAQAASRLDGLLRECEPYDNPLILGLLHYDRARIAWMARDHDVFRSHARRAGALFASTANPALLARARRLFELGRSAGMISSEGEPEASAPAAAAWGLTDMSHATRLLEEVAQAADADSAAIYLLANGKLILAAQHGGGVSTPVIEEEILSMASTFDGASANDVSESEVARALRGPHGVARVVPLVAPVGTARQLIGALVFGHCEESALPKELDLTQFVSELLDHDEATDVIGRAADNG